MVFIQISYCWSWMKPVSPNKPLFSVMMFHQSNLMKIRWSLANVFIYTKRVAEKKFLSCSYLT